MQIDGRLLDIMETWPLQLTIETAEGRRHVVLMMDTTFCVDGVATEVRHLRIGQRLRLEGDDSRSMFRAERIDLLEDAPAGEPPETRDEEVWVDATKPRAAPAGTAPPSIPGTEPSGPPSVPMGPPSAPPPAPD